MQEVVILFADDRGGLTDTVRFEAYERTRDLDAGQPVVRKDLSIKAVIKDRPFVQALLPNELDTLLQERILPLTTPIPEYCAFNIGYVSGNQRFFHPDSGTVAEFMIPTASLRSTVVASRELSGVGLRTSAIALNKLRRLFYPNGSLSEQERQYILQGESEGIDTGYKCNRRKPWYKVPDVRVPDLLLSVFGEVPVLVENDADLVASNSILWRVSARRLCRRPVYFRVVYVSDPPCLRTAGALARRGRVGSNPRRSRQCKHPHSGVLTGRAFSRR